jgi:hypothetical protein
MNPTVDLHQGKQYVKERISQLKSRNLIGVGIGKKLVKGQPTATDCVRVYVVSKLEPSRVRPSELVKHDYDGVLTDVIEIGRLGRKGRTLNLDAYPGVDPRVDRTPKPGSPIRVESDAPNVNSGATGTLGMVVSHANRRYILGCNHILAFNGRVQEDPYARIVSAVFVGNEPAIASPEPDGYIPLVRDGDNLVDCALARINGDNKVSAAFPAAFQPDKPDLIGPQREMQVKKIGAATGTTEGTIVDFNVDLSVDYSFGTYRFINQIMITREGDNFATAGDSGAIIFDKATSRPVGMIFAASGNHAIACPLSAVLESLQQLLPNGKDGKVPLSLVTHDA